MIRRSGSFAVLTRWGWRGIKPVLVSAEPVKLDRSSWFKIQLSFCKTKQKIKRIRKSSKERFSHDERERLAATAFTPHRVDGLMSWQESFTHDAAGNLTGPLTVTSGNRLTRAGNTRYEYDGYGNRILEVTGSEEHHYTWDTQHRLTGYRCRVRGQETAHYRYQYDALGRRILKEDLLARTARRFFWQGERLLGECDAGRFWPGRLPDNPQLQEALRDASCRVWLYEDEHDFRPLLMLCGREANAGVYHYVCDHLGTPLELRDVRGGVVWSAMLRSYGQVHHADTAGINQPLRFQGQYHDAESGLYYNRHRYYDPGVGRYLSPDPVGLDGGLNLYAYVPDPLGWIDPLGLTGCSALFKSRNEAFRAAKRDTGIPMNQQPDRIFNPKTGFYGDHRNVPMTDSRKNPIIDSNGNQVWTREYQFTKTDESKIVIQDHSAGHSYPNGIGDQGRHLNIRPIENTLTGSVPDTLDHYEF